MLLTLFILFALIPLAEIYVLITIGARIGVLNTIILVVVTAATGATLARWQGFKTVLHIRQSLTRGEVPASELIDGLLILIAGMVLLTPGFLTDAFGFFLLIPGGRSFIKKKISDWLRNKMDGGGMNVRFFGP